MAEVLARFPETIVGSNRIAYKAQACGARNDDGLWEGWIEFIPVKKGTPVRTARETTQPNRADAIGWANALSTVYLEGALQRALHPLVMDTPPPAAPMFDRPAPGLTMRSARPVQTAVLDPFSVAEKGEGLLRQELGALSAWHLVNIVLAYRLSDEPQSVLSSLPSETLINLIVKGVRQQLSVR